MNCPNCGKLIEGDHIKFCPSCGCNLQIETVENPYGNGFATQTPYNTPNAPEKKSKTPLIIAILAIVLVVSLATGLMMSGLLSGLMKGFGGQKTSKTIFYQSKGDIHMISDVTAKKDKLNDIEFSECSDDDNCLIGVDKSQKYFYYYSEFDYDKYEGTACVIPISQISDKTDKVKKATVEISDDVSSFQIVDGGKAVYIVDEDELYYFDGKKSYEIDDDVDWMTVYDDVVMFEKYDDDTYDLYYAKLTSNPKAEEVDDDIEFVTSYNPNFLVYSKDEDDGLYDLYVGTAEKGCEKFAKDSVIFDFDADKKVIWYGESNDAEITFNDFFENDLMGPEDVKMAPNLKEIDVDELLGDNDFDDDELAEIVEMLVEWYPEDEKLLDETGKHYYNVDSGYDDDDNYVYYYYCKEDKKWYSINDEDYYKATHAQETYEDFIKEWEDKKDEALSSNFYTLKYYKNGEEKEVADNVSYASVQNDVCYYSHISDGDDFEKISLKKIYQSYLEGDYYALTDAGNYMDFFGISYSISGAKGQTLDTDFDLDKFSGIFITKDNKHAYVTVNDDDESLGYRIIEYVNKDGSFEISEKKMAKNGAYLGEADGKVYYLDNYDEEDYVGDLYVRAGGESKLVSEKVSSEASLYAFGDEAYGFSDYEDYDKADFYRFKDGERNKVESDVAAYGVYALGEKMFVFYKGNDLYYTDGESEPVKLAKKVDYLETVSSASAVSAW